MSIIKSFIQIKNKVKKSVTKPCFDNKKAEKNEAEDKILCKLNELNNKTLQPEELIKQIVDTISKQTEERERIAKLKDQYNEQSDNCKEFIYWTCRICILLFVGLSCLLFYSIACTIIDLYFSGGKYIHELLLETVTILNLFLAIPFFVKTFSYEIIFNIHKDIVNDNFTFNDIPLIRKISSFIKSITCKSKSSNDIKKTISDVEADNEIARKKFNHNSIRIAILIFTVYVIVASIAIYFHGILPGTIVFFEELTIFSMLTLTLCLLVALTAAAEEWASASAYNFIALLISGISFILAILSILQTATPQT